MRTSNARAVVPLCLAALLIIGGCKKDGETNGGAAGGGSASSSAGAAAAGELAGTWRVADVRDVDKGMEGMVKDFKSGELTLAADKSCRYRNNMIGAVAGTWAVDGGKVVVTPAAGGTIGPRPFAVEDGHLVERIGDSTRVIYDRAAGAAPAAAAATLPPADFTLSAEEVVKAIGAGGAAKYNGKTLQITGTIGDARAEGSANTPVVTIGGGAGMGIECWMVKDDASGKLAKGQTVTVRGKADLGSFIRRLTEASVVKPGPG